MLREDRVIVRVKALRRVHVIRQTMEETLTHGEGLHPHQG